MGEQLDQELLKAPPVALLVVDSIASAVHWQFDGGDVQRRQQTVAAHAARLKYFADTFGCGVLAVNQVMPPGGPAVHASGVAEGDGEFGVHGLQRIQGRYDEQLVAYLGPMWAHCVNARLVLQHPAIGEVPTVPLQPPPVPGVLVNPSLPKPMRLRVAKSSLCAEATFAYSLGCNGIE